MGIFGQDQAKVDRKPAVAGQFYPSDPKQLKAELATMFSEAEPKKTGNVVAVILYCFRLVLPLL